MKDLSSIVPTMKNEENIRKVHYLEYTEQSIFSIHLESDRTLLKQALCIFQGAPFRKTQKDGVSYFHQSSLRVIHSIFTEHQE